MKAIHIKNVPDDIWLKARQNALNSGVPFKIYLINLLAQSGTLTPDEIKIKAADLPKDDQTDATP